MTSPTPTENPITGGIDPVSKRIIFQAVWRVREMIAGDSIRPRDEVLDELRRLRGKLRAYKDLGLPVWLINTVDKATEVLRRSRTKGMSYERIEADNMMSHAVNRLSREWGVY